MRLIDADALKFPTAKVKLDDVGLAIIDGYHMAIETVRNAPTIDAEPVVHARWTRKYEKQAVFGVEYFCSRCDCEIAVDGIYTPFASGWCYCPRCGAKMDGGADKNG